MTTTVRIMKHYWLGLSIRSFTEQEMQNWKFQRLSIFTSLFLMDLTSYRWSMKSTVVLFTKSHYRIIQSIGILLATRLTIDDRSTECHFTCHPIDDRRSTGNKNTLWRAWKLNNWINCVVALLGNWINCVALLETTNFQTPKKQNKRKRKTRAKS